jgi:HlyD family secretion protein
VESQEYQVFRQGDSWQAYRVVEGRAALCPVNVGRASDTETEILDGLKDGDEVILYPGDRIAHGRRVTVVKL